MTIYYTHRYKETGLASHDLLEAAIRDYTGDGDIAAGLVRSMKYEMLGDIQGKPYIEGFDKFSISHSGDSWAVLIDSRECGLDIQHERGCDYSAIAVRFFHTEDAAIVSGRSEFFDIWAKREALVKAAGVSVAYDDLPPVGSCSSALYRGVRYYISKIELPNASGVHAAICIDATHDIDEKLIYKEMYVKG